MIKFGRFKRIDARAERGAPVGPFLCRHTNAFDEKGEKAIRTAIQFSKVIADPDERRQILEVELPSIRLVPFERRSRHFRGAGVAVVLRRCGSFAPGV